MQTDLQSIPLAFKNAPARLLLLDYDGTLREFETDPLAATPTPEIIDTLQRLADMPGTTVVLISGRRHDVMQAWFSALPVCMVAEHGFYTRMTDGEWQPALQMDERWKPLVHEIFERCTAQVPLSSVEEKHSALAWHYRASDMAIAEPVARQAVKLLEVMGGTFPITVVPGHQVIEAHIRGIDKGTAARRFLDNAADKPWDFILAAGDDTTDEDLFKALPEGAFTVKVGEGESRAMSHVSTPTEMRQLLQSL